MDTVAAPALADIYQPGAERAAGDGRRADSPPAGAERFYHGPENEILTHEISLPATYVAGMGQSGMNCSIVNPKYGPRFRVIAVTTDLELPAGTPMEEMKCPDCTTCKECTRRCPSRAIDGRYRKNVFKCSDYGCSSTCLSV